MNRSARLIKEVLYRQLLKKRLRTAKGGVLTVEKLLSPGLCLLFTFNKINSSMLYTTCTITQYDGYATDIRFYSHAGYLHRLWNHTFAAYYQRLM